jgi:hypothetical protein
MENQSPVKICVLFFSSANRLRTLPLDNHLTSECKGSELWSACISSHKTTKRESLMGEFLRSSRLSPPLVAQNAVLVQGHVMLKLLYE